MRLCYVSHSSSHFTRPYVDYFARRGHEVHVISLLGPGIEGVAVHHPLGIDPPLLGRKLGYLRALRDVSRLLARLEPDIVHAHYAVSNGLVAAWAGRRPLVVSAHGSDLHQLWHPARRAALRYALHRADVVNPVSRAFEGILRGLGVPPERMLTLSHGVETRRFVLTRSDPGGPARLLCTRTLAPLYDAATIVRALGTLHRRGVPFRFTFAAGGPELASLQRLARRLRLDDRVDFLGGYDQKDLPAILARADICVSAARSDGASVSLLEAMASGVFPVVTDIAGNREWLEADRDALFFAPGDHARLASRLEQAIGDAPLRASAAARNRLTVERRGERDANLSRLGRVYEELRERSGR